MDDNVRVTVVMDIEHVEMKLLGGQWRECGRGVSQRIWAPSFNLDLKTLHDIIWIILTLYRWT